MFDTEAELKVILGVHNVAKEWESAYEFALKDPKKCAAAAIKVLEDGVKLFLDLGCGESVEFNENYTVQKAIHTPSFVAAWGLQGENNANCAYKIARTWVDKPIPQKVAGQLFKRLVVFQRKLFVTLWDSLHMMSKALSGAGSNPPLNNQPQLERNVKVGCVNKDSGDLFDDDEVDNGKKMKEQNAINLQAAQQFEKFEKESGECVVNKKRKHQWTYGENVRVVKYLKRHYVDVDSDLTIDDAVEALYFRENKNIKKSSIKMKIQNTKTLFEEYDIENSLCCRSLRNYSKDHLLAFKEVFNLI